MKCSPLHLLKLCTSETHLYNIIFKGNRLIDGKIYVVLDLMLTQFILHLVDEIILLCFGHKYIIYLVFVDSHLMIFGSGGYFLVVILLLILC